MSTGALLATQADPGRRARHHLLGATLLYVATPLLIGAVAEVPWAHASVRETLYAYGSAAILQLALWVLSGRALVLCTALSIGLFVAVQLALVFLAPQHLTRGLFLKLAFAWVLFEAARATWAARRETLPSSPSHPTL